MHDLRMVREHIDALRAGMRRRGALDALSPTIERAIALDKSRRETIQAVEERKAARNAVSQQVGQRKRAGESGDDLQQQSRALGDEIGRLDRELAETEGELSALLLELPNITLDEEPRNEQVENSAPRAIQTLGVILAIPLSWFAAASGFPAAALSIKRARFFRKHDRDAIADRVGKLGRPRNEFLILRVVFEGRLGARTHQDFQQPRIDPGRFWCLLGA